MTLTILEESPDTIRKNKCSTDDIIIISQYFIPNNELRVKEIKEALRRNVENKYIKKIYLLNERIYTDDELGINSDKIEQHNIEKRIKFMDFFRFVNREKIKGYYVLLNIDVFLDDTINNIRYSDIDTERKMFSLLRYEYRGEDDIKKCNLFGSKKFLREEFFRNNPHLPEDTPHFPEQLKNAKVECRADSWDTWIIHSNNKLDDAGIKAFNFEMGKLGCDNKIIYLLKILGFDVYNDPKYIRTYHNHREPTRNYTAVGRVEPPYAIYTPYGISRDKVPGTLGINVPEFLTNSFTMKTYNINNANNCLTQYLNNKIKNNEKFVIPRIAGEENNFVYNTILINEGKMPIEEGVKRLRGDVMKNNAGIKISDIKSAVAYSNLYLKAFNECDMFSGWEPWGAVYRAIQSSHDFITNNFKNKEQIWAYVFDIYHYLYSPWTHSLRGKRILIISPFIESIKEKIPIRKEIYGVDLFPDCEFILIKPPQTQATEPSEEFDIEFHKFVAELDKIKDDFDIALCSCGGYGNLVCGYIYDVLDKSAIYVGGVLQMYFGIYGSRWLRERKDIMRMFLNKHWSRPKENEKPKNCQKVENSAYW